MTFNGNLDDMRVKLLLLVVFALLSLAGVSLLLVDHFQLMRPPRPLFSNHFAIPEKGGLFKEWIEEFPLRDEDGWLLWCDFEQNMLLLVNRGEPEGIWVNEIVNYPNRAEVAVGPERQKRYVTVQRSPNRLIVLLADGIVHSFRIEEGTARRVCEEGPLHRESLLTTAETCLRGLELARFKQLANAVLVEPIISTPTVKRRQLPKKFQRGE